MGGGNGQSLVRRVSFARTKLGLELSAKVGRSGGVAPGITKVTSHVPDRDEPDRYAMVGACWLTGRPVEPRRLPVRIPAPRETAPSKDAV